MGNTAIRKGVREKQRPERNGKRRGREGKGPFKWRVNETGSIARRVYGQHRGIVLPCHVANIIMVWRFVRRCCMCDTVCNRLCVYLRSQVPMYLSVFVCVAFMCVNVCGSKRNMPQSTTTTKIGHKTKKHKK